MKKIIATLLLASGLCASQVYAQNSHNQHNKSGQEQTTQKEPENSTEAYKQSAEKMHSDMNQEYTGDADKDFAIGMIPHHQGAIDMAKIVLKYGKDPELKKLAEDIIAAQEKEIKFLKDWIAKNEKNTKK